MDISRASYKGLPLSFLSATGITSPGYYEEPGLGWLRGFYAGLLTTCGITNAGAPSTDEGVPYGIHGRVSNAGAEEVGIVQEWDGSDYVIKMRGVVREAQAMGENMALVRRLETKLGRRGFTLRDTVENRGFLEQPLMMLYHCNFGFPLLGPEAKVVGPIKRTTPRDDEAAAGGGVEECLQFPEPVTGYKEKVFFHDLAADSEGRTFIALVNGNLGGGCLGLVMRFNIEALPRLTQWKMPAQGFYVVGLEPGTITPLGRGPLRESAELPFLASQDKYDITIDYDVLDTPGEIEALEKEASSLVR
jgi:hypothetical protein